jgi:hypothetical protein
MIVNENDRVILNIGNGKELKGFIYRILKYKDTINYIIQWDDGKQVQYTKDKIHFRKDIQYHRNIKIDQIILNQPEKNFPI